jgi:hypothetical protein
MPRKHPTLDSACPFCDQTAKVVQASDRNKIDCITCGTYVLTGTAADIVPNWTLSQAKWAAMSYRLRRLTDRSIPPVVDSNFAKELRETASLPRPDNLLDEVVIWMARHSAYPGAEFDISYERYRAVFGAVDQAAFRVLVGWIRESGYVDSVDADSSSGAHMLNAALSPAGWQRFRSLTEAGYFSRTAFMAMQFGDAELDAVFLSCFVPAVSKAGFELRRLDQGQGAGLIDDQLRVAIRTSRFVVCDLTHGIAGPTGKQDLRRVWGGR